MPNSPLLARDLKTAVAEGRLGVAYQPIFTLASWTDTSRIPVAVEALSRWKHSAIGNVSPVRFIPLAQRADFLDALDRAVFTEAIAQLRRWKRAGHTVGLSVNASPTHFAGDYVDVLLARTEEADIDPGTITVEIIEAPAPQLVPEMAGPLTRLRKAGVSISVDDFGAGDTTIEMIERLPVDEVKIDRSLIQSADAAADDAVRSVVAAASDAGWRVVAEGIETEEDLARARQRGCDRGQGYMLGRPSEPEAIEWRLRGLR
jgi:EAL domain-containing protein (putative c-di-GMP-specific phosphodiesterase class I)